MFKFQSTTFTWRKYPGKISTRDQKINLFQLFQLTFLTASSAGHDPVPPSPLPPPSLDLSHCLKDLKARLGFYDDDDDSRHSPFGGHRVDCNDSRGRRIPNILIRFTVRFDRRMCDSDGIYIRNCWDERELPWSLYESDVPPRSESRYPRMARNPRKFRTREIARFYTPTFFYPSYASNKFQLQLPSKKCQLRNSPRSILQNSRRTFSLFLA